MTNHCYILFIYIELSPVFNGANIGDSVARLRMWSKNQILAIHDSWLLTRSDISFPLPFSYIFFFISVISRPYQTRPSITMSKALVITSNYCPDYGCYNLQPSTIALVWFSILMYRIKKNLSTTNYQNSLTGIETGEGWETTDFDSLTAFKTGEHWEINGFDSLGLKDL